MTICDGTIDTIDNVIRNEVTYQVGNLAGSLWERSANKQKTEKKTLLTLTSSSVAEARIDAGPFGEDGLPLLERNAKGEARVLDPFLFFGVEGGVLVLSVE